VRMLRGFSLQQPEADRQMLHQFQELCSQRLQFAPA